VARSYALVARATFHGRVVEERFFRTGAPLELGRGGSMHLPVPEGLDFVARVLWTSPAACAVKDAAGRVHDLVPGQTVELEVGPVRLELTLVERVWLPRFGAVAVAGTVAWFSVVLMATVLTMQITWLTDKRCDVGGALIANLPDVGEPLAWVVAPLAGLVGAVVVLLLSPQPSRALGSLALPLLALALPVGWHFSGAVWKSGQEFYDVDLGCRQVDPPPASGGHGTGMTAEYLARLLKNDLDGSDQGVIDNQAQRPKADKETKNVYMPAGSVGPITDMGGAEQVAPTPIRTVVQDEVSARAKRKNEQHQSTKADGRPMAQVTPEEDPRKGAADGLDVKATEDATASEEAPAEEKEGWGFPEWYDEHDKQMDNLEITLMLRMAQQRLRIDPDDAAALSIKSYYQYLAQDYEGAKKTYDRYIELFPDDPAGYNNKALVYKRMKQYQQEEALYRVALSLSPDDETALNNLAVNLSHQHRFDEALAVMKHLEQIDPQDPYADLHRSKIYAEMNRDDESLAYLEKALEGMDRLDTLHHIEFRQDIRLDPSFEHLRDTYRFRAILNKFYGKDTPLEE
jgi:regulator of sirC expression with transglutaminase-like and TPR domain